MIGFNCPGCGKMLKALPTERGKSVRCEGCLKPLRVPEDSKPKSSKPKKAKQSNHAFLIRMGVFASVLAILLVVGLLRIVGILTPITVTVDEPANLDLIASSTGARSRSVSGPSIPFKAGGLGHSGSAHV